MTDEGYAGVTWKLPIGVIVRVREMAREHGVPEGNCAAVCLRQVVWPETVDQVDPFGTGAAMSERLLSSPVHNNLPSAAGKGGAA